MIIRRLYGPAPLTNVYATDVYVPPSALVDDVIRHIHVANVTGAVVTFRLFLGATGANAPGTELWYDQPVAANGAFDWYGMLRVDSADFLVGGASAGNALTITIMGDSIAVV